jgi:hypothetical protein
MWSPTDGPDVEVDYLPVERDPLATGGRARVYSKAIYGLAAVGTARSGNPSHVRGIRLSRRVSSVVQTLPSRSLPNHNAFPHRHQCRFADSLLQYWAPWAHNNRRRLLACDRRGHVLERMLASLGQLQIPFVFSRRGHRHDDLRAFGSLRVQPIRAVRCSFDRDGAGRGRHRWFLSPLVCPLPYQVANLALHYPAAPRASVRLRLTATIISARFQRPTFDMTLADPQRIRAMGVMMEIWPADVATLFNLGLQTLRRQ